MTKKAIQRKQSNGEYIGGFVPYGFQVVNGKLIEDDFEQNVIHYAIKIKSKGLSLLKVSAKLAELGFNSRNGSPFYAQQINRMCKNSSLTT